MATHETTTTTVWSHNAAGLEPTDGRKTQQRIRVLEQPQGFKVSAEHLTPAGLRELATWLGEVAGEIEAKAK
jgi:hypothetical protein